MKNSFVLYTNYFEILKDLDNADLGAIFRAILSYKTNGQYEIPKHLELPFKFLKNQLDIDNEKWLKTKEARSVAGKKHKGNQYSYKSKWNKMEQNGTKRNKVEQMEHNVNDNVNDNVNVNVNDNVINDKRENIKEKSLVVAEATTPTPQAEVFEFFAKIYKQETNIDYLGKKVDYINLAKLIKKYGKAMVIQKIRWLLIGCRNSVFFFSKDMTDFNISTLTTHWDRILPKLTDEQKREQEKKRKEEEQKKRVLAELEKQGIVLEGGNNVRLQ